MTVLSHQKRKVEVWQNKDSIHKRHVQSTDILCNKTSMADLLLSRYGAGKFRLGAIQLQLPSSRHLGERLAFLNLLLLFDLVQEKLYECLVT